MGLRFLSEHCPQCVLRFSKSLQKIGLQRPRSHIGAESAPGTSRGDLELPALRAVRARVAVLEFSAVEAKPYHAVDPRLHVVLPRGRTDAARVSSSVSVASVNCPGLSITTAPVVVVTSL